MEKHICKLSQRQLSLSEKATLSDTLILAKTAYLSNVFPIPDEIIYKDVLQKASQNHVIAGKIQWKNILPSLNFTKIWKNTYFSYRTPHTSENITHSKQTNTLTNAAETKLSLPLTVTSAIRRKIYYISSPNVTEKKMFGNTTNQYTTNCLRHHIHQNNIY